MFLLSTAIRLDRAAPKEPMNKEQSVHSLVAIASGRAVLLEAVDIHSAYLSSATQGNPSWYFDDGSVLRCQPVGSECVCFLHERYQQLPHLPERLLDFGRYGQIWRSQVSRPALVIGEQSHFTVHGVTVPINTDIGSPCGLVLHYTDVLLLGVIHYADEMQLVRSANELQACCQEMGITLITRSA